MGVEPFLVASSVDCVLAQRLARRLCPDCKVDWRPKAEVLIEAGFRADNLPEVVYKAGGCKKCGNTGYRGRLGVHEVLMMTEEIARMCVDEATTEDIKQAAIEQGMLTLRQDGLEKVRLGMTSIEEIVRVIV
jgi:type IV pilus assembly protein PilB